MTIILNRKKNKKSERIKDAEEKLISNIHNPDYKAEKFGTVGHAVSTSRKFSIRTSTGGMTNKKWNRIGDAPIWSRYICQQQ